MSGRQNDSDSHYKMCKKIAQLTKVIYQLNTQNEDNDARVAELRGRHETEVQAICDDAERRVEEMRKVFRAAEEQRVGAVDEVQRQCEAKLAEAKNVYTLKVASMVEELSTCKNRFAEAIAEVKASCELAAEDAAAKKCAAKDEEMANLVREYNERYKTMLAEQMDLRDSLEEKVRMLQSQLDASMTRAAESQQLAEKLRDGGAAAAARAAEELAHWKESSNNHEVEVRRLHQECDTLKQRLKEELNSLSVSRGAGAALQNEAEELRQLLGEAKQDHQNAERMINEKTACLAKAQSDITDLENQRSLLETQNKSLSYDLQTQLEENREMKHQVKTLQCCIEKLQKELKEAERLATGETERHHQIVSSLEDRCAELERRLDECARKHNEELAALRLDHEKNLDGIHASSQKLSETLVNRIRCEKEELAALHATELQRQQDRHRQEVEQLKHEHLTALKELRVQLSSAQGSEKDLRSAQEQMRKCAAALEEELNATRTAMHDTEARLRDVMAKYETLTDESAQRLQKLEASAEAKLRAEREANANKKTLLEEDLSRLQGQFASEIEMREQQWNEKNRLQTEAHERLMEKLRMSHKEELRRAIESHEVSVSQMDVAHKLEIRQICEAKDNILNKERNSNQRVQKELEDRIQQREKDLKQLQEQLTGVRQDTKEQGQRLSEELRKQRELVSRLTAEEKKLQEKLHQLSTTLYDSREKYTELERDLQAAKKREQDMQLACEELKKTFDNSRLEMESMHKAHITNMDLKHTQGMRKALDDLRVVLTAEQDEMRRRADGALAALRQKYTNLQDEVKSLKMSLDSLTQDLRNRTAELAQERENLMLARRDHAVKTDVMRCSFENEKKKQILLMENQLNEVGAKHAVLIDDLMKQHAEERKVQDALVQELQAALDDLRYRYEYRESRSEDVAMINHLINDGKQKDQALKKALNDMKMYKLELINREENYNKVFGRRPLVASSESADKVLLQQQQQQGLCRLKEKKVQMLSL